MRGVTNQSRSGTGGAQALQRSDLARGPACLDHLQSRCAFTSKALEAWDYARGVQLDFARLGKPSDNGHIESFSGRLRDERLNVQRFLRVATRMRSLRLGDRTTTSTVRIARRGT